MPDYMQMPADDDLITAANKVLREQFGEFDEAAEQYTFDPIEATDHGDGEWTALAQVYDCGARKYVGVMRWRGQGEDLEDMEEPFFEPQSCAE